MPDAIYHVFQDGPAMVAPYSHAVQSGDWLFLTGQMPFTGTANDSPYPEGIEAQTRQVFANLRRVLEGIGLGLEHVLSARVFLLHFERDYALMNAVYQTYFPPGRRPARTCVGVSGLARGALVEIDFVARRPAAAPNLAP